MRMLAGIPLIGVGARSTLGRWLPKPSFLWLVGFLEQSLAFTIESPSLASGQTSNPEF